MRQDLWFLFGAFATAFGAGIFFHDPFLMGVSLSPALICLGCIMNLPGGA